VNTTSLEFLVPFLFLLLQKAGAFVVENLITKESLNNQISALNDNKQGIKDPKLIFQGKVSNSLILQMLNEI